MKTITCKCCGKKTSGAYQLYEICIDCEPHIEEAIKKIKGEEDSDVAVA